jgi:hypothetical protein
MSKGTIRKKWLSFSEETNAIDYLEHAYRYIYETEKNINAWKWVILSLHGALYGFAICALKGTNPDNVTFETKKGEKRLIGFYESLKRCQDPKWMKMKVMSKHLQLSDQQKESIRILKEWLRNEFEHYMPKGWLIEIHGIPQIVLDVLEVIRFLALETGNYICLSEAQKRKINSLIFQSKRSLKQSQLYKEFKLAGEKSAERI